MKGDVIFYEDPNFRSPKWNAAFEKTRQFLHLIFDKKEVLKDIRGVELHFPERLLNATELPILIGAIETYAPFISTMVIHTNNSGLVRYLRDIGFDPYLTERKGIEPAEPYSDEPEVPEPSSPV